MPMKRSKAGRPEILAARGVRRASNRAISSIGGSTRLRSTMSGKTTANTNEYRCVVERNQNGKYNVRVRAVFSAGRQGSWTLPVYFLASSFNAAMKKLEESLQLLQKNEERLCFWGVEHSDDPNLAGDLLQEFGLWLDRRREYPRKVADLSVPRGRPVAASMLAPLRRVLADSVAQERPVHLRDRAALASD
jgi:hypothetical protein